jgi:hypothetical protein
MGEYMRDLIRSVSRVIMVLAIVSVYGCYHPCTMKVHPLGTLDTHDYDKLQAAASQLPPKVGSNIDNCVPQVVYYLRDDYDFSRVRSIYIPDFRSLDEKTGERVTRNTADDLASLLLQKSLFVRVERFKQADADIMVDSTIIKYQEITAGQTAMAALTQMPHCGLIDIEVRLIDLKTGIKVGAIQVNHVTFRGLGLLAWAGSTKPETQIPGFLSAIFEKLRAGQTAGTNGIWSDCTRVDNGKRLRDLMCN